MRTRPSPQGRRRHRPAASTHKGLGFLDVAARNEIDHRVQARGANGGEEAKLVAQEVKVAEVKVAKVRPATGVEALRLVAKETRDGCRWTEGALLVAIGHEPQLVGQQPVGVDVVELVCECVPLW